MSDCVFCKIVGGELPSHRVFEDEHVVALMDAYPLTEGHVMVIPRRHFKLLQDLPEEVGQAVLGATLRLTGKVQAAMKAPATTVGVNNGREAGQAIPHVHVHIVPRYNGDGGGSIHTMVKQQGQRPVEEVFKQIQGQ